MPPRDQKTVSVVNPRRKLNSKNIVKRILIRWLRLKITRATYAGMWQRMPYKK